MKLKKTFPVIKVYYGQPLESETLKNDVIPDDESFIYIGNVYPGNTAQFYFSKYYFKLISHKPSVVVSGFNIGNLNIYLLFILKYVFKFRLILWSFGYDPRNGFNPETKFSDSLRLFFYQRSDAVIFYWDQGRTEIEKFSSRKDHYFVAPNTLDTERQFELKNEFDLSGRDQLKIELGVKQQYHFIYIGRLLEDKQIDLLLRAYKILEKINSGCRLSIIGDGPMKNILEKLSAELELKEVHFLGEILDEVITGKWIYISDAFILPGRLGLSVVHSFCFGTPVISQMKNKNFHGEGIGYMKNGINGFLTQDGNLNELAGKMNEIITDPVLSGSLRHNAFETAKNECSITGMVQGFSDAINFVRKLK